MNKTYYYFSRKKSMPSLTKKAEIIKAFLHGNRVSLAQKFADGFCMAFLEKDFEAAKTIVIAKIYSTRLTTA